MKPEILMTVPMRRVILLAGLLQGLLLYLIVRHSPLYAAPEQHPWWVFVLFASMVPPVVLAFAGRSLRQSALWASIALLVLVTGIHSLWINWNIHGLDVWQQRDALRSYFLIQAASAFLALPWVQSLLSLRRIGDYSSVFMFYWQNALTILMTLFAAGLIWIVLWLCASLFELIGILFFRRLFFDSGWFGYLITGGVATIAIVRCRSHAHLLQSVQHLLTVLAGALLPVVAVIMALFVLALPVAGLDALSGKVSGAGLLNTLCLLLLLLMTLVWHPTRDAPPYSTQVRRLIFASLFLAPICALVAAWAIWLRVEQYGWTPERIHAGLVTLVLLVWSVGYVAGVLLPQRATFSWNRTGSLVLIMTLAIVTGLHTPLLDPWRISVNSQMARFAADKSLDIDTVYMLAHSQRRGREALMTLDNDPAIRQNPDVRLAVRNQLRKAGEKPAVLSMEDYLRQIELVAPSPQPEAGVREALTKAETWRITSCKSVNNVPDCVLLAQDLNADGHTEWILFNFSLRKAWVLAKQGGSWKYVGAFLSLPDSLDAERLRFQTNANKIVTHPRPWRDLSVGESQLRFSDEDGY